MRALESDSSELVKKREQTAFFALADNHGVLLRGLQRDDEGLEELFHRVLAESKGNGR